MSTGRRIDLKQDRRQWLKNSATILGASLLPMPMVSEIAEAEPAAETPKEKSGNTGSSTRFLTPAQYVLVDELTETIIPSDSHSGGAKAARVAEYIEQVLQESVEEERRAEFQEGLRLVDLMSRHYSGKSFVESDSEQRIAILTVLSENEAMTELPEVRFFRELRALTIQGYYTSKIGIHDDLDYKGNRMIVEYVGCDDPPPPPTKSS
jgi:hypothetical protein